MLGAESPHPVRGQAAVRSEMPSQHFKSETITSRNHPSVRRLRGLHSRVERDRAGAFLVEGVRFLTRAVQHRAEIETLIVAPQLLTSPFGRGQVRALRKSGVRYLEVTPEVFHTLAQSDDPQGVAAVVRQSWARLSETPVESGCCWVALSAVQSPGNLGTLVRTCEAVGAAGVILLSNGPDPYDASAVRASMGSLFSIRFARSTPDELVRWKKRHGGRLIGTSPIADTDYQQVDYNEPVILFMGWERQGLTPEEQGLCDDLVRIPMTGKCDSLNLAVATSLMLYEVFNQHRRRITTRLTPL